MSAQAKALVAALRVLEDVEWGGLTDHPDGGYSQACPRCDGMKPGARSGAYEGHTDDCPLADVLRKARGGS